MMKKQFKRSNPSLIKDLLGFFNSQCFLDMFNISYNNGLPLISGVLIGSTQNILWGLFALPPMIITITLTSKINNKGEK